ncbi:MAG: ATP-binding cassette domain-containing protein, partial [Gemmatimonadota bacterium]
MTRARAGGEPGGVSAGPAARLSGVRKRFGATVALDGAHLSVDAGEVHGVLGENGAGKTTLLEILAGHLRPDAGEIRIGGSTVHLSGPREAWSLGVGMVHQHFTLVPRLSVIENLALGVRGRAWGLALPLERVRRRLAELRERTGLDVPRDARVEDLGVGERQRVEILKVLLRDPSILVLDEPTAVLAPPEVERLLALLRSLAGEGRAVVLVAHKLDEILGVADRVTVLRDGRTVLRGPRSDVDAGRLARAMVGEGDAARGAASGGEGAGEGGPAEAGGRAFPREAKGEVVARLEGVRRLRPGGAPALEDVSLEVRRGEVVGVAGVEGNG